MAANNIPKLNIVMIGDSGTGKTSLASVFVNGQQSFPEIYITTNEKEIFKGTIYIGKQRVELTIWDLSGSENFRTITTYHYGKAQGIMLCYSLRDEKSWQNIDHWIENAKTHLGNDEFNKLEKSLVGLKNDSSDHCVAEDKATGKANLYPNTESIMTSAKKGVAVNEAFYNLAERMYRQLYSASEAARDPPANQDPPRRWTCSIL
eukprot:Seg940.9 transcript_id=Seg940.9/GoldUCD/mRNA.D3Y31 product="Ras-related protein RABE1a" protein_id=Seg940.9/GoldUCD/D3Y31